MRTSHVHLGLATPLEARGPLGGLVRGPLEARGPLETVASGVARSGAALPTGAAHMASAELGAARREIAARRETSETTPNLSAEAVLLAVPYADTEALPHAPDDSEATPNQGATPSQTPVDAARTATDTTCVGSARGEVAARQSVPPPPEKAAHASAAAAPTDSALPIQVEFHAVHRSAAARAS